MIHACIATGLLIHAGGLIYVSGGDLQHRNGADVYYKFRPSSNFAYLTGVTEPGFACLLDPETQRFTLVAPKVPEDAAVWWGGLPSLDQLAEQAGADACIYAEDLPSYVQRHHAGQAQLLALPHFAQHQQQAVQQLAGLQALKAVQSGSTNSSSAGQIQLSTAFLESTLHRCRATKTAAEIGCLLEASCGSSAAHKAMWAACQPGIKEFQLEAAFAHAAGQAGLMQLGYPCIVGAGRNAAILHYERNSATVGPNDLVLVDAGAEFRHYTADITRTFPASGKFTAQQRDIYNLVLSLQQHALARVKPGVAWAELQQSTRHLLLEQLQQLGIVKGSLAALTEAGIDRVFMPHGLGHFLGLDVHDVSDVGPVPERLEAGHVITVEPGVYFMPLLLQRAFSDPKQASLLVRPAVEALAELGGVRIEDNVLVTADGHLNLTMAAGMPKEADEIEAYMAAHNVQQ
ncbi:peptidase M24, structural domain-containing protein [Scenedesmus sp. NREL 46B-D3]|nr:peptidase M24, structural domain-containing protein [Scenedesmus sp. NREL 46B-D3]